MEDKEQQHKRRVRYNGTHPKYFNDKYKELQPEKYADTVDKILQKGNTPAGMHIPVMVDEILNVLAIKPGEIGLDATLGYGGHTCAMLNSLESKGHIYALDIDPIEINKTRERLEKTGYGSDVLTIKHLNFANVAEVVAEAGKFDFILADLGVSSMQIDNPDRGFSFKKDGPLDLRMNPEKGMSAAQRLKEISRMELEGLFVENADEPYAKELSKAIISKRKSGVDISTTMMLHEIIKEALAFIPVTEREETVKKSSQRTFQALRIDVNNEFDALSAFLEELPDALSKNGRVAILTFHSGEDRLVKKSFKFLFQEGVYKEIAVDVIRPTAEECSRNSRARSTKMRWAIKG